MLRQIVYFSTAVGRQDFGTIAAVLAVSQERNSRDGVTGMLVAGGNRYLQVIEGPSGVVGRTMSRIQQDGRHLGVTLLVRRRIEQRSFAGWSMAHCDHLALGDFATLAELVDEMRAATPENRLREQIDCFARSFVRMPASVPAPSPWTLASGYEPSLTFDGGH